MNKKLSIIFWILVGVFLIILIQLFVPGVAELLSGELFLLPMIIFCILGIVLLVRTLKSSTTGWLRKFLKMTGLGSTCFFIGTFLHNAFYALAIVAEKIIVLKYLFEFLNAVFFLVSVLVCPLVFIVGVIGTIILIIKIKKHR